MRRLLSLGAAWLLASASASAGVLLATRALRVTEGRGIPLPGGGLRVEEPRLRAVVPGMVTGPASVPRVAELRFVYGGPSRVQLPLQSGELRRQVGLKLRARDGCNVIYVMWRILPREEVVVSVKSNPGLQRSDDCGNGGYQTVRPVERGALPVLVPGVRHSLRAELRGVALKVWVDGTTAWEGVLPAEALAFDGPVGLRTDNGRFELELHASP